MADIDGSWNIVSISPTGVQTATLTVRSAGNAFGGDFVGDEGTVEITDGRVDGDKISWSMKIVKPMPMTLTSQSTLKDDMLDGTVTAGMFGSFPMSGTRA